MSLTEDTASLDAFELGRRIRTVRKAKGLTLDELAAKLERVPSQLSMIENGKREPKLSLLKQLATALGIDLDELISEEPLDERSQLEVDAESMFRSAGFKALNLPGLRISPGISSEALQIMTGLYEEITRLRNERLATPEEARRANAELRQVMRARNNYFEELEEQAAELLTAVGHSGGPVTQQTTANIASHLGFSLHYVNDLPHSTRSVTDRRNGRIYLPARLRTSSDPRAALLHGFSSTILGHDEPQNYADYLRQRVEANYLAGALLMPEADTVAKLQEAKKARQLSIEDLRDAFAVSYETAAHRFTNLATKHLDLQVHFMKVNIDGTITKAYENDNVAFPTDSMGAIEGQVVCRQWTCRTVFDIADRFNPHYQYTDTSTGTFWCTSRVQAGESGEFSVSVGVPFNQVGWFRGRETQSRAHSQCPDERCCRQAPAELEKKWGSSAWPTTRTPASLLASLPTGVFPGVDRTEMFEFLERHEPRS